MVYFNEKLEKLKEFLILSGRVLSYEPFFLCVNYSFRSIMLVIKISKKEILYSLFAFQESWFVFQGLSQAIWSFAQFYRSLLRFAEFCRFPGIPWSPLELYRAPQGLLENPCSTLQVFLADLMKVRGVLQGLPAVLWSAPSTWDFHWSSRALWAQQVILATLWRALKALYVPLAFHCNSLETSTGLVEINLSSILCNASETAHRSSGALQSSSGSRWIPETPQVMWCSLKSSRPPRRPVQCSRDLRRSHGLHLSLGYQQSCAVLQQSSTDFSALKMILRVPSRTQNYVCMKQSLWALFYIV